MKYILLLSFIYVYGFQVVLVLTIIQPCVLHIKSFLFSIFSPVIFDKSRLWRSQWYSFLQPHASYPLLHIFSSASCLQAPSVYFFPYCNLQYFSSIQNCQTKQLTNYIEHFEKLIFSQLVNIFPLFNAIRRFNTVFTRPRHLSLYTSILIQSTTSNSSFLMTT